MTPHGFQAVTDDIPAADGRLVICLGRPSRLPSPPGDRLLVFDQVDDTALGLLSRLDPRRMADGLTVVTTRLEHARAPREVLLAHKLLAYLYVKFVDMPSRTTRIPDPLRLRPGDTPPEYLHLLNRYRNTPFHLRHGLVDKLRDARIGMPCLLLLPGPSLKLLAGQLPELSRRHLVITISRTLPFLRECGVIPDILVQLDTVPLQGHFHHPGDRFPESVLLALSQAPIRSFATRFRQIFFIDSFDLSVLPNPSRIRESWLSSLLVCLGCAETLHAPRALLAGADLRHVGNDVYCTDPGKAQDSDQPFHDAPPTCENGLVTLADARGRKARTTLQFFATAAEAEMFAREIRAASKTTFHSLSPWSLLDPGEYAPMSVERALEAPVLDKRDFLAKADAAAASPERRNLLVLRAIYTRNMHEHRKSRDILTCLQFSDPKAVRQHPCHRYAAANIPWFRPRGEDNLSRVAKNLADDLYSAARFARNVAALYLLASRGEKAPVLCTAEEEADVAASLTRLAPGWTWRFLGIRVPDTGRADPSSGSLDLETAHDWLHAQDVVIVAPGCAREFDYALSLLAGDNVLGLGELLAYAPEAEAPKGPAVVGMPPGVDAGEAG